MTTKRRELTEEEKACAARLKDIWEKKRHVLELSQERLGIEMGMSQSAVGQYLNAKIPLNLPVKISFAMALQCDLVEIDPEIPFSLPSSPDEKKIIDAYRAASTDGRDLILGAAAVAPVYKRLNQPDS
jgi:transcriptional regulator with XRE-family HTH domain